MNAIQPPLIPASGARPAPPSRVGRATRALFAAQVLLTLATPSWRVGPFTWLPVVRLPMLAGRPADLGLLSLLPGLIVAGWLSARAIERPHRQWRWGRWCVTLPLLGLTLLVLRGLDPGLTWRTVTQAVGMGLAWLTYLFMINERPDLATPLALVILIQGVVAVGQFLHQRELGLAWLGELILDREASGISVVWANDQRWLRAYGLTGHPNFLGAMLAVLLLLVLPDLSRARGGRRAALTLVASTGVLGLLTSFSRAAWLAFSVGLLTWIGQRVVRRRQRDTGPGLTRLRLTFHLVIPAILGVLFLVAYRDLVISRFVGLDTPIEARSLDERQRDLDLAQEVIERHPWWGVGAGNYLAAVRAFEPDSRPVHNVALLVAAELGLIGAALWAWLMAGGLRPRSPALGAWLATILVGLFDVSLWLTTSWRAAIIFALLAARASCKEGHTVIRWPLRASKEKSHAD